MYGLNSRCGTGGGNEPIVVIIEGGTYAIDRAAYNQGANAKFDIGVDEDLAQTVVAKGPGAVCYDVRLTAENSWNKRANVYRTETSRSLHTDGNEPTSNQGGGNGSKF